MSPIIKGDRADTYAYAITDADIPVYSCVGTVDTKLSAFAVPNFVAIVFAYNFEFVLKIWIDWQKITVT